MSDVLFLITISIISICAITVIIYWLLNSNKRKSSHISYDRLDEASSNISKLDTIIETCVGSVNKKMVSNLKNGGIFMQSDKEEALHECKKMIYSMLKPETIEYIRNLDINTDAWIHTRIEYYVRKQKGSQ
jgi:hypothetical protein